MGAQQLPQPLTKAITQLLEPLMKSESEQRAILIQAFGAGAPILRIIDFKVGTAQAFTANLVDTLWSYGVVQDGSPHGKLALELLLESVKPYFGSPVTLIIDDYLDQINDYAAPVPVVPPTQLTSPVVTPSTPPPPISKPMPPQAGAVVSNPGTQPVPPSNKRVSPLRKKWGSIPKSPKTWLMVAAIVLFSCTGMTVLGVATVINMMAPLLTRTAPIPTAQPTNVEPTDFNVTAMVGTRSVLTLDALRYNATLTAQQGVSQVTSTAAQRMRDEATITALVGLTLTAIEQQAQLTRNAPVTFPPVMTPLPFISSTFTPAPTLTPPPTFTFIFIPPTDTLEAGGGSSGFSETFVMVDTWTGRLANQYCNTSTEMRSVTSVMPLSCDANTIQPQVMITFPYNGMEVGAVVPVTGTVIANDLSYYRLEYATYTNPYVYYSILEAWLPIANGTIGMFDTRSLPNGSYILRLVAISQSGGYVYRSVNITINNNRPPTDTLIPLPTDTISPFPADIPPPFWLPTLTWTFIPFFTPMPFDFTPLPFNAIPTGTPTATVIPP